MAALKKHMMTILFGVAVVGSLGLAGWAYTAGEDVTKQLRDVDSLKNSVRSAAMNPANTETIAKQRELSERRNQRTDATVDAALRPQKYNVFEGRPRQLLIPGILPEPSSAAARINFRGKYNAAFAELNERLRARDKPTDREIQDAMTSAGSGADVLDLSDYPWHDPPVPGVPSGGPVGGEVTKAEALRSNPASRVAERVAKSIYMYVNDGAMGPAAAGDEDTKLTAEAIWHAHMTLWIAQDFAAALGGLNEARAAQLDAAGHGYDAWVGHMPVKQIQFLNIDNKLGRGGGIHAGTGYTIPNSFTRDQNDSQHFMVPIRLTLVVEEAAVMDVLQAICSAGYYTPIRVQCKAVEPNALQEDYIYGDDPVVEMTIDMEAYFFRVVYDDWIPQELKKILATPGAVEESKRR